MDLIRPAQPRARDLRAYTHWLGHSPYYKRREIEDIVHTIDYADTNFSSPTVIDSEIFIWTDIKKFGVLMKCKFCTNCGNYLLSETIVENTYLFNKILCSCNRVTDDIDCHEYQIIDNNYQIIDNYCRKHL